jgi:hypothetical protein
MKHRLVRSAIWIQIMLSITHAALLLAVAYLDVVSFVKFMEELALGGSKFGIDFENAVNTLRTYQTALYNAQLVIYALNVRSLFQLTQVCVSDCVHNMQNLITDGVMVRLISTSSCTIQLSEG